MQDQSQHQAIEVGRQLHHSRRPAPRSDATSSVEEPGFPGSHSPSAFFSDPFDTSVPTEEAEQRAQEAASMWGEANDEINTLFDLMSQVQAKLGCTTPATKTETETSGELSQSSTNLRACNWGDVMAEVQTAAETWKRRPNRDSKMVGLVDKMGQNSAALETWIQLLPKGDYGASICGVFKLTINAASQYGKIEETVIESLSEIPRLMDNAARYVQIYRQMPDQSLERYSFQLFRTILKTLRLIMQFFLDGKRKKIFSSLIKQDSYGSDLLASVEDIKKCVLRVNEEAEFCMALQISSHGQTLSGLQDITTETSRNVRLQSQEILEQRGMMNSIHCRLEKYEDVARGIMHLTNQFSARQGYEVDSSRQSQEREAKKAAVENLMRIIQYDPEAFTRDIMRVVGDGDQLSYKTKSRASALIVNPRFREFMSVPASTALLVNGHEDSAVADGISPLSLVVSRVIGATAATSSTLAFPLCHFCNSRRSRWLLREDGRQPGYAPLAEMAASLVGQLLCLMDRRGIQADIPFIAGEHGWGLLGRLKVNALIKTLDGLIDQLPPSSVVMCTIDDVGEYETGALSGKLQEVMGLLTGMTQRPAIGVVFKLLVTCRNRALDVGQFFPRTLDMEEDIEEDTSAEWTISQGCSC